MDHPYKKFEGSELWTTIEESLKLLQDNDDIKITTRPEYVIGYLCSSLMPLINSHSE